jgi:hypothetical protein
MSTSGTQTTTYSVVDVRKVVDCFAADFSMKAQATGLRTRESVAGVVSDLKIFAENGYLSDVQLILKDDKGTEIRGTVYTVSDNAVGWSSDRPGNNLWPRTPGGTLKVIATMNQSWWDKTDAEKTAFISRNSMYSSWAKNTDGTSLANLSSSTGQRYASNGYGWQRTNYA